jgi:hypothetical protein
VWFGAVEDERTRSEERASDNDKEDCAKYATP